jgi:hypothetical protein
MNIITVVGGRELPKEEARKVRLEASISLQVARHFEERDRERHRPIETPDRLSVSKAMEAVEARLVAALWTLARLPGGGSGGQCGLSYIQDATDRFSNAVANGGKWEEVRPRPPIPSGRAIDAMHEPLRWLSFLQREHAQLVSTAAGTKRGDVDRHVSWGRVRMALPQLGGQSVRTLQRRYDGGIRAIVAQLTVDEFTKTITRC